MRRFIADIFSFASFLSRVPFWKVAEAVLPGQPLDFRRSAWAIAPAALLAAIPAVLFLLIARALDAPSWQMAIGVIAVSGIATGFLHEDGLADVADGFGGGTSRARKLDIMRDSTIGTYGAMVLLLALALKIGSLLALFAAGFEVGFFAYLAAFIVSRCAMLWPWVMSPPARKAGLAVSHGQPKRGALAINLIFIGIATALLLLAMMGFGMTSAALILCASVIFAFTGLARRQIGGFTGDTLGATQQLAEITLLVSLAYFVS
jgi:adenosylcobinamide-GDP ribazoletransferase